MKKKWFLLSPACLFFILSDTFATSLAPTPVNVTVNVSNASWIETIAICNTSGNNIPLKNIAFEFNYASPMPSVIWGTPWAAWKLASQTGSQVILTGGTPLTPSLPSDPFCMRPLTIQFYAPPTLPAPSGPFVFKADAEPVNNNCPFDSTKTCNLFRDILNDKAADGLGYYAPTNYDHRMSGEINIFDATLVQPYSDAVDARGQIKLLANKFGNPAFKAGQIMTRINLDQAPYNSPTKSHPFTTKDIQHGYLEVKSKMPKCDTSDDGLCQNGSNPDSYNRGLWPAIWMMPSFDANWPQNGEIDIMEAYQLNRGFNVSTSALHFNGNDPRCGNNDCVFVGYSLANPAATAPLYNDFHTWGFEWEPDPKSTKGGLILTGYFDNMKVWGPLATDSLPADGPNALSRGFNDPAGGFYLIIGLAIGGPYAGAPNPHMLTSSMYLQSIKAYTVDGGSAPPIGKCLPPVNIQSSYSADRKQITLTWQKPANSDPMDSYQIGDWQNRVIWTGTELSFLDKTLPGTPGTFTYFLYSRCTSGLSSGVKYDAIIK